MIARSLKCPAHLDPGAKKEWGRMIKLLPRTVISAVDTEQLAFYCVAASRWAAAEVEIDKTGPVIKSSQGVPVQNPYLSVANVAMRQMNAYLAKLRPLLSKAEAEARQADRESETIEDVNDFEEFPT